MIPNFEKIDKYLINNKLYPDFSLDNKVKYWKSKGLISKVRRNTYLPSELADKFKIACASVEGGVLCYHAALEFYLLQTQEFNLLYVNSTKPFRTFSYQGVQYTYKSLLFLHKPHKVNNKDGFPITVTSLEQTVIDCIYNINLAGGLEELTYALKDIDGSRIKETDLLKCLNLYNSKSLYQRTGFLLSAYKYDWNLSENFFNVCKMKSSDTVSYLINPYYCSKFDKTWNICIPENYNASLKY